MDRPFSKNERDLIWAILQTDKETNNPTPTEFELFINSVSTLGLNPLTKEVYGMRSKGKYATVVGIDGYVKKANESGMFRGFTKGEFTVLDKARQEIMVLPEPQYVTSIHELLGVTVGVRHADDTEPTFMTCRLEDYIGGSNSRWRGSTAAAQLLKCAQALAIRRRFTGLEGTYIPEELDHLQAPNPPGFTEPSEPNPKRVSKADVKKAKTIDTQIKTVMDKINVHIKGAGGTADQWKKLNKALLNHFHIEGLSELHEDQASDVHIWAWSDGLEFIGLDSTQPPPEENTEREPGQEG